MIDTFLVQDFPVLAAGLLASVACALVGCFLVLRRMSLMGDAISHAVVPGIVAAFLLSGSLKTMPVLAGAAVVGVITASLTELIHRLGKVEPGAAMGVVFTVLFAAGVIMLEQLGSRTVHLDADCVLYGAMEGVIWPTAPTSLDMLLRPEPWQDFPRQVTTLAGVVALNGVFVIVLFKELRISSFDPELAAAQGMSPSVMHYLLMTLVAITTVAAFEAVGSILVVAMLIVPGLAAHLLTERLGWMLIVSVLLAVIASVGGYAASAQLSVNAAAMIGVAMGALLIVVGVAAPKHGWISRSLHRASLSLAILREDLLGCLYRLQEAGHGRTQITAPELRAAIGGGLAAALALWWMRLRGEARVEQGIVRLTGDGAARAASLVRSHRLWEAYLVEHLGLRPDHVHE
ncbi:MAG: metal ABC transporter permease, partial [Planctomycetota bacterium]